MMGEFRRPLGLVLAGGGAHGAWQAAVVEHLANTHGIVFDHILSFSIGALTGAAYCLDRLPKLIAIWKNITSHRILRFKPSLFPPTLYGNNSLWEMMRHVGSEEQARRKARCLLTTISLCVESRKHVYSRFSPEARDGWDGPMTARLVASCSIPQVFPSVRIKEKGRKRRTYVDGGCPGKAPFRFDALGDCRDVLVLQMTRPEEIGRQPSFGLIAHKLQHAREGLHGAVSDGLEPLKKLPKPPRIFRFYPTQRLDYSMLSFESRYCIPALYQGIHDAHCLMIDPAAYQE